MISSRLNDFQVRAAGEVLSIFHSAGLKLELVEHGEHETFLAGTLPFIEVWIYDDELEFKSDATYRMLEKPDFATQEEMIAYFVAELEIELSRAKK